MFKIKVVDILDNVKDFRERAGKEIRAGIVRRDQVRQSTVVLTGAAVLTSVRIGGVTVVHVWSIKRKEVAKEEEIIENELEKAREWEDEVIEEMKESFPKARVGVFNNSVVAGNIWRSRKSKKR